MTPTGTNANVYTGTVGDGNYTGTFCQYKFVYFDNNTSQYVYENIANRDYNTPASAETFPTVYFNNETNAILLTFQVDMTLEIQEGTFVPGQPGQQIECRGSFQNPSWSGGFTLTNNPNAANTNIFSGVAAVTDPPGTVEQYKFVLTTVMKHRRTWVETIAPIRLQAPATRQPRWLVMTILMPTMS